jgi:hypothetical protein
MARALLKKEVYIRFADEPAAFVYTVRYGRFTVKSERIPVSMQHSQTVEVNGRFYEASDTVKQLLRKPHDR